MKFFFPQLVIFIYFVIVFVKPAYSQFIINSNFNPAQGDTTKNRGIVSTGLTPGGEGANQTWNFANIIYASDITTKVYVSTSSTPYQGTFPASNICCLFYFSQIDFSCNFWQTNDTAYTFLGHVFGNSTAIYQNPDIIYHYPLSFGSIFTDQFYSVMTAGNTVDYVSGTRTLTADGYGTLILPTGTYNNVLRVKSFVDAWDTTKVNGVVTNVTHYTDTEYDWFIPSYKFPIFILDQIVEGSNVYKNVRITEKNIPLGINKTTSVIPDKFVLLQNYPNPFNPTTNIKYQIISNSFITIKIFDILGKEIAALVYEKQKPGTYEVSWNASAYPSGVYYYRLITDNYSETKKMILIK